MFENATDDPHINSQDEEEEIDWEDAEVDNDQNDELPLQPLSIVLTEGKPTPSKSKKRPRYTAEDKQQSVAFHRLELVTLFSRALLVAEWSFDEIISAAMLSLLPPTLFLQRLRDRRTLHEILGWFRTNFARIPDSSVTEEEGCYGAQPSTLLRCVSHKSASGGMLVQLFSALCIAAGASVRFVMTLDPMVPRPAALKRRKSATPDAPIDLSEEFDVSNTKERPARMRRLSTTPVHPYSWVELLLPNDDQSSEQRWVAVDCLEGKVDRPAEFESKRPRGRTFAYVAAISPSGQVVDVTQRYASRWSKSMEYRLQPKYIQWWERLIQGLCIYNDPPNMMNSTVIDLSESAVAHDEALELQQRAASEPMPTSLEGFKKHSVYCMEQFLAQTQCLYPREPVAVFKGYPVFFRKHVQPLHTSWQWKKMMKQVLISERSKPAKKITRHGTELDLYGEWQTVPLVIEPVTDGIIPLNKHGNVQVWDNDPRFIPAGAAHLPFPGIKKVARELGVQCAEALTGFETKNGRRVPVIEGIVVLADQHDMILSAYNEIQALSQQKAEQKRESKIVKRWEQLVRAALTREELRQRYGH